MIERAVLSTLLFLAKTLPVVVVAVYLVSYSIRKGYLEKLADRLNPWLRKLGISEIAIVSVTTCFVSPTASYSILSQAWKEGKIGSREIIVISFLNSFPSMFSHLYTFFIPFVLPVLGFAGVVYTAIRFTVAVVKSLIGLILARKWGSGRTGSSVEIRPISPRENVVRIALIMFLTYFMVSLLTEFGIFDKMDLNFLPINPSSLAIAGVELFNVRAAVVLAAGFIDSGLNWKWAVIGLILGNVISFSARAVKHSLPMHVSFFGKFGVKIVLLNSIATLFLDVLFLLILILA